jgi:hypothetical protein
VSCEVRSVLTVSADSERVESQLFSGALCCPCGGVLAPWGSARPRVVLGGDRAWRVRPRRGRCRGCGVTHVLLATVLLLRRGYAVAVIGRAFELVAGGVGRRRVAEVLAVPRSTVRGWLARLSALAEGLRAHFLRWLLWLDASRARLDPAGGVLADAVMAVLAAGAAAVERLDIGDVWEFAAAATGGRLLANTSAPFPAPWTG